MWIYLAYNALVACGAGVAAALRGSRWHPRRLARATVLLLLPAAAFLAWVGCRQWRFVDFKCIYFATGHRIFSGLAPTYTPFAAEDRCLDAFVNIPILGLEFLPFGVFGRTLSTHLFTAVGLVATFLAYRLVRRYAGAGEGQTALIAGLFLINGPLSYSLTIGNYPHVILLLLAAALASLECGSPLVAGTLLALAGANKIPLLIFGPFLALRREAKAFAAFCATLALLFVASVSVYGLDLHRSWAEICLFPFHSGVLGSFNNQSIDGVLARTLLSADPYSWLLVPLPPAVGALRYLLMAAIVSIPLVAARLAPRADRTLERRVDFAAGITVAVLISPVSWTHYEAMLLLPIAVLLGVEASWGASRARLVALVFAVVLLSQPVVWWRARVPMAQFVLNRILLTHYTVGAVVLLVLLAVVRLRPRGGVSEVGRGSRF
jgi:hypothetical protein